MRKKFILFAIAFLLQSGTLYAQAVVTAYKARSSDDWAILVLSTVGPPYMGKVTFTSGGQEYYIISQANPYTTGGVTIDYNKMYQMIQRGNFDPSSYTKTEPMKFIHTDFASSGYRARFFNQDSPRDGQADITIPSGKTVTYYYDRELTSQVNSNQQQDNQNNNQPSYNNSSNSQPTCPIGVSTAHYHYNTRANVISNRWSNYRDAVRSGNYKQYELNNLYNDIIRSQQDLKAYREEMNSKGCGIGTSYYETMRP